MTHFKFLHAADLHLDSPLTGLASVAPEQATRIASASRQAFNTLIETARAENCRFVVIAGDVFDGSWQDYRTGLFFADGMRRLDEADIGVYLLFGNHDAENQFAGRLDFSPNVHVFSSQAAESIMIDDLAVVLHGQSFPRRDVTENLALGYPPPRPGWFNVGLLHTACGRNADGHALYAPSTVEQLEHHGYEYWALGHIHGRAVLSRTPWIVYPGNLQGRHIRETGAKGATLVTVVDGAVTDVVHHPLDTIRWTAEDLDLTGMDKPDALQTAVRQRFEEALTAADGRDLALRLTLVGTTSLDPMLRTEQTTFGHDFETIAASVSPALWLEKTVIKTTPPRMLAETADPTVAGRIREMVDELAASSWAEVTLEKRIAELTSKLPGKSGSTALFDRLRQTTGTNALALARALIASGRESGQEEPD